MTDGFRRQLSWYAGGTIVAVAASATLFLVYARSLPADQLGALVVAQATVTMLRILGTAGTPLGMFRYLAGPPEDRAGRSARALLSTTLTYVVVATAALGALALLVASPALGGLPGHDPVVLMVLVALTAIAWAPREVVELVLRADGRAATWSAYSVFSSVLIVGLAAFAVLFVAPTAEAILLAQLIGLATVAVAGLGLIRRSLGGGFLDLRELRAVLRLGIPNSTAVLLDWILHSIDRYILLAFATATEIGVYGFGSRLGLYVQQLGGAAAQTAWDPYSFSQHRQPEAPQRLGRTATLMLAAVLGLAVAIGAGAEPLVRIIGGRASYVLGAAFAFPIGLALWLGVARNILLTPLTLRFRPEIALIALAAAAVVNITLDLALIPSQGIYGAAIATVASYAVGFSVGLALVRGPRLIAFEPGRLAVACLGAVAAYAIGTSIPMPNDLVALFARPLVALVVYALVLMAARIVPWGRVP